MRHLASITVTTVLSALAALPVAAQMGNPGGMKPATPESAPGVPAPNEPNAQDRLFVQLISAGGMAEVDAGKLAGGKAHSAEVKTFARRMVQEHSKANDQLADLARQAGIPVPVQPNPAHKAMHAQLVSMDGPQFDLAYLRGQLVDHQKTVQILEWEINSGQDANLQRFASATLPAVLQHLEMVQGLMAEMTGAAPQGLAAAVMVAPREPKESKKERRAGE